MLHSLEIENFKSWAGRHRLELGRLTGLFGANSSGKSSIIHLLLLLKQTVESREAGVALNFGGGPNDYIDLGSYKDIVTEHDLAASISYTLHWTQNIPYQLAADPASYDISLSTIFEAKSGEKGENIVVKSWNYTIQAVPERSTSDGAHEPFGPISISIADDPDGDIILNMSLQGRPVYQVAIDKSDPDPLQLNRFDPILMNRISRILFDVDSRDEDHDHELQLPPKYRIGALTNQAESFRSQLLNSLIYLGPLRTFPRRNYTWTGTTPATVGYSGEQAIQVLLAEKRMTVAAVSKWMRKLGIAESLSLEPVGEGARIWEALIEQQDGAARVNLADVGFGVSQVLPVIVALLSAQPGSLVILEHPEIHLHPRIQSELADLLIDIASAGEIQILVESHSEHLLARIQRRIAEANRNGNGLTPEDVRLYFCELEQGKSKLTPLEMLPSGVITNWPDDFFGDMLAERMALSGFYPNPEGTVADR